MVIVPSLLSELTNNEMRVTAVFTSTSYGFIRTQTQMTPRSITQALADGHMFFFIIYSFIFSR
jgi:hypothetical protein